MITKEQAQVGVKVKIPTQKSEGWMGIEHLQSAIKRKHYILPYLLISSVGSDGENVILKADASIDIEADQFLRKDLDLYEDAEAANPTSYPLTNEEQVAYLHGQADEQSAAGDPVIARAMAQMKPRFNGDAYPGQTDLDAAANMSPKEILAAAAAIKPAHYNDTAVTPFQVINAWGLDFYLGNIVKYLCRREKKGNELADLRKAATYLAEKIKQLEAAE